MVFNDRQTSLPRTAKQACPCPRRRGDGVSWYQSLAFACRDPRGVGEHGNIAEW